MTRKRPKPEVLGIKQDGTIPIIWESPDGAAEVRAVLAVRRDRYELTELAFKAKPDREIMSDTVRVRVEDIRAAGLRVATTAARDVESRLEVDADTRRVILAAGRAAAKHRPSGARGWGDDFYRMVALEYIELTNSGAGSRGVLTELARRLAKRMGEDPPRSRDNVRDWVATARAKGFLVPIGKGRAGAMPGPRLYDDEGES